MYFCHLSTPAEIQSVLLRVPVSDPAPSAVGGGCRALLPSRLILCYTACQTVCNTAGVDDDSAPTRGGSWYPALCSAVGVRIGSVYSTPRGCSPISVDN